MTKHTALRPLPPVPATVGRPDEEFETGPGEIVARPDGYHWIAPDGRQEFGPYATLELAQAARDAGEDFAPEPGESLQEVEAEIGVSDWIDPNTGELAEGTCPPHLDAD
jgi:hypothetical protein